MPPIARRRSNRRVLSRRVDDSHSSADEGNNTKNKSNDSTNETCTDVVMMQSPSASRQQQQQQQQRRRSSRGHSCLTELAKEIVTNRKRVVFITGAGISVASGVRPFRGKSNYCNEALWTQRIWTTATREIFRKDPLEWYNDFWIPFMTLPVSVKPNAAHLAMNFLLEQSTTTSDSDADADADSDDPGRRGLRIKMITQNVDGLIPPNPIHSIEAHGRVGLYKCIPDEDSDTDSESDDDDDRLVHLGHRRKWRRRRQLRNEGGENNGNNDSSTSTNTSTSNDHKQQQRRPSRSNARLCPFQHEKSLSVNQIEPSSIQRDLRDGKGPLPEPPKCPHCTNILAPQALLFDEGYHSHDFYEFQKMEEWLGKSSLLAVVVWKVLLALSLHINNSVHFFSHFMLLRIYCLFSLPNSRS